MDAQPILETARLRLRPFEPGDAGRVRQLAGDERIADVTAHIPHPYPDGVADWWIGSHRGCWEGGTGIIYAVIRKADESLIGAVSIVDINEGEGELGYWVGVSYWGQGYCTEAVRELLRFSIERGMLRRIHARHLTRNPASGRVLAKVGFAHRGHAVAACGFRQERELVEIYEFEDTSGRFA